MRQRSALQVTAIYGLQLRDWNQTSHQPVLSDLAVQLHELFTWLRQRYWECLASSEATDGEWMSL